MTKKNWNKFSMKVEVKDNIFSMNLTSFKSEF